MIRNVSAAALLTTILLFLMGQTISAGTITEALSISTASKLLVADNSTGDFFGNSVSVSRDTVIIGSPYDDDKGTDSGSAFVFIRDNTLGIWTEQAILIATDGSAYDRFGSSVSISGDTSIIGALSDDDNDANSGSAYVFVRDNSSGIWTQKMKLNAKDGSAGNEFGNSVSISGDTVVIGAHVDDGKGSAYVFVRNISNGTWTHQMKLIADDGSGGDEFGTSVAISGDTIIIGASDDDDMGANSGSAYVFVRDNENESWIQQTKLSAIGGKPEDRFGSSVSISGDTTIIGAHEDKNNGSGSAYVFVRDNDSGNWMQQAKLNADDTRKEDMFGNSVSISDNTAVIGAQFDDDSGSKSGSAHVFVRDGTMGTWTEHTKLIANDARAGNEFGNSVSISGDTVFIGGFRNDNEYSEQSGSAYTVDLNITPDH